MDPPTHRRALYDLALFYKIRSNMININFPPIVQPSSRQPNKYLHVQALHFDAYKYNFFNSTIRTWNIVPNQALSSANVTHFKTVTRNWITHLSWSKINSIWTSSNKQEHVCGLILERSLAEAFHSLNVIVPK